MKRSATAFSLDLHVHKLLNDLFVRCVDDKRLETFLQQTLAGTTERPDDRMLIYKDYEEVAKLGGFDTSKLTDDNKKQVMDDILLKEFHKASVVIAAAQKRNRAAYKMALNNSRIVEALIILGLDVIKKEEAHSAITAGSQKGHVVGPGTKRTKRAARKTIAA